MGIRNLKKCFIQHASDNISFRDFARSDVFPLFEATKNNDFNKFLLWSAPSHLSELIQIYEDFMYKHSNDEILFFSITKKLTGEWMGVLKFSPYENSVEGSFWIHPAFHGNILVFEALQAVIEIVFNHPSFDCVFSRIKVDNYKIRKLMINFGFSKIGESTLIHQNGAQVFCDIYKLEKSKWNKKIVNIY